MPGANPNYARTYEVLDKVPELANENETHYIYYCPYCEAKRGKKDYAGKLYFSKQKLVGLCFKCNSVVLGQKEVESEADELKQEIDRYLDDYLNYQDEHTSINFKFDKLTIDELTYLRNRNMFLLGLIDKLGFQRWSGSKSGIVIPFWYRRRVARFQVRFITQDKFRYYTSPGAKLLYSPDGVLNDFNLIREDTVTLAEGVFDSIAMKLLGYPNPLAILGSSVTHDQMLLLRKLMPGNIFVALDTWEISRDVSALVRKLPSVSDTKIVTETLAAKDPEKYISENYARLESRLTANYLNWLS